MSKIKISYNFRRTIRSGKHVSNGYQ